MNITIVSIWKVINKTWPCMFGDGGLMSNSKKTSLFVVAIIVLLSFALLIYGLEWWQKPEEEHIFGEYDVVGFVSPDNSYEVLVDVIRSANYTIFIEMYSMSHPFLAKELNDAINRGVKVIVIFEHHHVSPFENMYTEWAAYNLTVAGASVYWANDTEFSYTHSKFIIIDNTTVVVESANWVKTGIPVDPSYGNREWGIVIRNEDLAQKFLEVFLSDLAIAEAYVLEEPSWFPSLTVSTGSYTYPFKDPLHYSGNFSAEAVFAPENAEEAIIGLLNSANESIYVQQNYIYLYWGSEINPFVEALVNASNRGVSVKVIIDAGTVSISEDAAEYLSARGVEVRWSNTTYFETTHNKGIIIDEKIVLISSINWSETSVRKNREAGVIVYCEEIAQYYASVFEWDWNVSSSTE